MEGKFIIKNATVIPVDKAVGDVLKNCDVLIEGPLIKAVGSDLPHSAEHTVIDGTNAIVSPGFVDTHRHTWQTQLRTVTTDFVLSDYILALRHIYGSSYAAYDAYIGNYCGALEPIDNGITYLVDHSHIMNSPDHADAAIKGLRDAKIRAVFCYCLYENPVWEGGCLDAEREKTKWRMKDSKRVREQHFPQNGKDQLVRFGFAPNEMEITPVPQLLAEIEHARSIGAAVITAHNAYGQWNGGKAVVRQMEEKSALGPDILLSHSNSLNKDDLEAVVERGVGLSSTPDTELQMADLFQQMRLLLQAERIQRHEEGTGPPTAISRKCAEVLEMATQGGANAVGLGDTIGSITPGKRADLIITRCDSTRLVPVHDPIGALVLYANGSDIDTVFIDGVVVKSGGKLSGVDWPSVRDELRASTASIMARAAKAPRGDVEAARDSMVKVLTSSRT